MKYLLWKSASFNYISDGYGVILYIKHHDNRWRKFDGMYGSKVGSYIGEIMIQELSKEDLVAELL